MSVAGFGLIYHFGSEDAPFNLQRLNLRQGTRARLEALPDFELKDLSGWAPVQAEGTFDSRYFYPCSGLVLAFRARRQHERHSFSTLVVRGAVAN